MTIFCVEILLDRECGFAGEIGDFEPLLEAPIILFAAPSLMVEILVRAIRGLTPIVPYCSKSQSQRSLELQVCSAGVVSFAPKLPLSRA